MTRRTQVAFLVVLAAGAALAKGIRTRDPLRAFVRGTYERGNDYFIHGTEDTTLLRCVLTKATDGLDGVALSELSIWGNHGGPWDIFRRTGDGFVYDGTRELPDTSCLESCRSKEYLASGRCTWRHGWPDRGGSSAGKPADRP